jgi:hypothetical protein
MHLKQKHVSLADRDVIFKRRAEVVKKIRLDSSGSYQQTMLLLLLKLRI